MKQEKLLIDTRTDREIRSEVLKRKICARFSNVRRLLDNPARPRKAILIVAEEMGVSETYVRIILKQRGIYIPNKLK